MNTDEIVVTIVFVVIIITVTVLGFFEKRGLRKCSCGRWFLTEISCSGEDVSHREFLHFHEYGKCKCGKEFHSNYTDLTKNHDPWKEEN